MKNGWQHVRAWISDKPIKPAAPYLLNVTLTANDTVTWQCITFAITVLISMSRDLGTATSLLYSGGSSLAYEDCGRIVDQFIPRLCFFFFFFKVKISSRTIIPLFMRGSVQSDSATVAECTPTSCVCRARFRLGSHVMPRQRHSQLAPTSLSQGCMRVYA